MLIRIWQEAVGTLARCLRSPGWAHLQQHAKSQLIVLIRIWLEAVQGKPLTIYSTPWVRHFAHQCADMHLAGCCGKFGLVLAAGRPAGPPASRPVLIRIWLEAVQAEP